jgi:hypothetical protein
MVQKGWSHLEAFRQVWWYLSYGLTGKHNTSIMETRAIISFRSTKCPKSAIRHNRHRAAKPGEEQQFMAGVINTYSLTWQLLLAFEVHNIASLLVHDGFSSDASSLLPEGAGGAVSKGYAIAACPSCETKLSPIFERNMTLTSVMCSFFAMVYHICATFNHRISQYFRGTESSFSTIYERK